MTARRSLLIFLGVLVGLALGVALGVQAWQNPTLSPPNGNVFRVAPSGDPGCTGTSDLGKFWMNIIPDPDELRVCRENTLLPGFEWQTL